MFLVTNVSRAEGRSNIPTCGNNDDCEGIWCGHGRRGRCEMWTCEDNIDCRKIVRCNKGLPGPWCMEGICSC